MATPLGELPVTLEIHCHPEASVLTGEHAAAFLEDSEEFFATHNSRPGDVRNHVEIWIDGIRPIDEVAMTASEMRQLIARSMVEHDESL